MAMSRQEKKSKIHHQGERKGIRKRSGWKLAESLTNMIAISIIVLIFIIVAVAATDLVNYADEGNMTNSVVNPETENDNLLKEEPKVETKPETQLETMPETKPETECDAEQETESDKVLDTEPEIEPETMPDTKFDIEYETFYDINVEIKHMAGLKKEHYTENETKPTESKDEQKEKPLQTDWPQLSTEKAIWIVQTPEIQYSSKQMPNDYYIEANSNAILNEELVMILARLIYNEGGNQPLDYQKAVGSVFMNQLENPFLFPDTFDEILHMPNDWVVVTDDWLDDPRKDPSETSIEAARWCLAGGRNLPPYVLTIAKFLVKGTELYFCWGNNNYFGYLDFSEYAD